MTKKLNDEQVAAIKHRKGPLMVIAGAGTGKTTVITERIKYLISNQKVKPSEILALTFTEKAAREMEERVDQIVPYGYTQMWIMTFHSFCDRVLRSEALHIGLNPRYKLMRESEAIQFLRNHLFQLKLNYFMALGNPTKLVDGLLQHFSRLQDEDINPSDYGAWVKNQFSNSNFHTKEGKIELRKWQELARAYKEYDELKIKNGFFDFGDLIVKALELFRKRPNILKDYQKQFKYLLVDEYQDTNIAQNELTKLLASHGNVTVVLDDDQSVYRFRGAAISNALQFRKVFPKTKVISLLKNYRSTQEILDKAYALIQNNNPDRLEVVENIDKKLVSVRSPASPKASQGDSVIFLHESRIENEADAVAKEIEQLTISHQSSVIDFRDIAILVRANAHAEPFSRALQRRGIPYQFLGPGQLFHQPEVVDLIAYLKVLNDFEDSVSFYRVLSIPFFDINPRDLVKISSHAKRKNLSLFEACEKIKDIFVAERTREKVEKVIKIINRHFSLLKKETAGQILYFFLEETGLIQNLLKADSEEAERRARNISKFFDKLKTYEVDHEDAGVSSVTDWLELSSELGESPLAADTDWTETNAVNILTVHGSKGLEFPVVFLVNLVSQRFPSLERRESIPIPDGFIKEVLPLGDFHLQEERRLFYVGMTRAKNKLYFTAADYYGEGKREKKLSPFIFEALGDDVVASEQPLSAKQLSFLDYSKTDTRKPKTDNRFPIRIDYLSYSQIQTFEICPLHYRLKYILKIPTPPTAAQSFGTSIHAALRDFYLRVKAGEKPSVKLILATLSENWVSEGFLSKAHEQRMLKKGKTYLTGFLEKGFDEKVIPVLLEHPFTVPLQHQAERLKIGGKFDRVDLRGDGSLEVIDYKTSENVPSQKEVDKDFQLTFYALATSLIDEPPFAKKAKGLTLSLYFLKEQKKISTVRSVAELEKAKELIFDWRQKIEKSDFQCSKHRFCENCEYSLFCRSGH